MFNEHEDPPTLTGKDIAKIVGACAAVMVFFTLLAIWGELL